MLVDGQLQPGHKRRKIAGIDGVLIPPKENKRFVQWNSRLQSVLSKEVDPTHGLELADRESDMQLNMSGFIFPHRRFPPD